MARHEEKTYSQEDLVEAVKTVAKTVAEEMGATMMAVQRQQAPQQPSVAAQQAHVNRREKCLECGQEKRACGEKHVKMVVYPERYPEFGEWFQGRYINGVRYLSSRPGHKITVPADCVGDITRAIEEYETNERVTRFGRTKMHNSGDMSAPNLVSSSGVGGFR